MAIGTEPMAAWTNCFRQVGDGGRQFFFCESDWFHPTHAEVTQGVARISRRRESPIGFGPPAFKGMADITDAPRFEKQDFSSKPQLSQFLESRRERKEYTSALKRKPCLPQPEAQEIETLVSAMSQ